MILTGILVVTLYITIMCFKLKLIPKSVSAIYYQGGGIWQVLIFFISSFLITAGMINYTEGSPFLFVSFLSGIGLTFVGASPNFRDKLAKVVHNSGAIMLLLGSLICIYLFFNPIVYLLWIPGLYWIFRKDKTFWCEITCILTLLLALFI